jgi:serine/threonine-protein kinase
MVMEYVTIMKLLSEPAPSPRSLNAYLPEAIEPVILRALAKEPDARYGTASELAEALARPCGGDASK